MKDKILKKWEGMTATQKKKVIVISFAVVILLVGLLVYMTRDHKVVEKKEVAKKDLTIDRNVLEKNIYMETKKELEQYKSQLAEVQKKLEDQEKALQSQVNIPPPPPPVPSSAKGTEAPPAGAPPTGAPPAFLSPQHPQHTEQAKMLPTIEKVGDISVFSSFIGKKETEKEDSTSAQKARDADKKKDTIYLPPSFMEATLLSGLDAPTVESGRSNPVPVLIRIKNLAILPNEVKANLKGCFVIAEGFGDLSTERANLRLVTLSCVSKGGSAIIDQPIKGFVVDTDGKIGLKGKVVSKMGSSIVRAALSGFFGGLGTAVQNAYTNTSVSLAGTTTQVDPSNIGKVAVGAGISHATKELEKFYLELAKQSMPIIEVGATKTITLVISEGVQLKIISQDDAVSQHDVGNEEKGRGTSKTALKQQPPGRFRLDTSAPQTQQQSSSALGIGSRGNTLVSPPQQGKTTTEDMRRP